MRSIEGGPGVACLVANIVFSFLGDYDDIDNGDEKEEAVREQWEHISV